MWNKPNTEKLYDHLAMGMQKNWANRRRQKSGSYLSQGERGVWEKENIVQKATFSYTGGKGFIYADYHLR